MQITVPTNLGANPLIIMIAGVRYALGAGETVDVPAEVVSELNRMQASKVNPAPAVDLPFEDPAVADLEARMTAVEAAAAEKELPEYPDTDGTYGLQLVMDDDKSALTWEAAEAETTPAQENS